MSAYEIPLSRLAVTPVHAVEPGDTAKRAGAMMERFKVDQVPVIKPSAGYVAS